MSQNAVLQTTAAAGEWLVVAPATSVDIVL